VAALSCSLGLLLAGGADAVAPNPNPWLQRHFLNMAHQGGEDEAPSSTMFAFKSAIAERGADSLELDVNLAKDDPMVADKNELMVIHNDTVNNTTETTANRVSGTSQVNDLTIPQVQALDAGYTFRPGGHYDKSEPASAYPYRGMRSGSPPPPPGYTANDFRIPTLREVLDTFPDTPINIEIKMVKTTAGNPPGGGCVTESPNTYCDDEVSSMPVADALAALLDEAQYASRDDILVVSFSGPLIDEFNAQDAPPKVALAPAANGIINFMGGGTTPTPDVAAFQVPPVQSTIKVPEELLSSRQPLRGTAHEEGYAVHVFTNGDQDETDASYAHLYNLGVDGIMSSDPGRLAAFLCANHIPRPDGTPRGPSCVGPPVQPSTPAATAPAAKRCKKHRKLKRGKCVKKKRKHRHR
jgi:glycerophosphoryl diester phosphodiesterase